MPRQPPLFGEPKRAQKKRGTPAPDSLTPPQMRALGEWSECAVPWLRREALESFENLSSYVEEILDWWKGDGGLKADWPATIRNRIRNAERRRLTELAKSGNEGAKAALRDPIAWAEAYDATDRAAKQAARAFGPKHLDPGGGGEVVHLGEHRRPRR